MTEMKLAASASDVVNVHAEIGSETKLNFATQAVLEILESRGNRNQGVGEIRGADVVATMMTEITGMAANARSRFLPGKTQSTGLSIKTSSAINLVRAEADHGDDETTKLALSR